MRKRLLTTRRLNVKSKTHSNASLNRNVGSLLINNFIIYYTNKQSAEEIYEEVFNKKLYDFETDNKNPFIIDGGSNIGISMLFFKNKFPSAKMLCFEPDPNAFRMLQKNVEVNNIKNVMLVNAALSNKTGYTHFYGEVDGEEPDARGNSIIKVWGNQRKNSAKILVKTVQLSSYIDSKVDFLKLDIEGAEQQVLEEIEQKLSLVVALGIEVHEAKKMELINHSKTIYQILKQQRYELEFLSQDILRELPKQIENWVKKTDPKFYLIRGKRQL